MRGSITKRRNIVPQIIRHYNFSTPATSEIEMPQDSPFLGSAISQPEMLNLLTKELITHRRPVVILTGPPGSGKSTIVWQFTTSSRNEFNNVSRFREAGPSAFDETQQDDQTYRSKPNLAVFDDIDFAQEETLARLPRYLEDIGSPQTLLVQRLAQSFASAMFPNAPIIQLPDKPIFSVDVRRKEAPALIARLITQPWLDNAFDYKGAYEAVQQPFFRPGLLGPDGKPVAENSLTAQQIITDTRNVNLALLAEISRNPDVVYELTPRRWEELVAQTYADEGYDVSLTQPSKDGGYDIQLVRKDRVGSALILVECKRYSPNNPVELGIVKQLHSTILDNRATQGVVVTTSRFTKGAKLFEQRHQWQLSLTDYTMFRNWLRERGY